MQPRGIRLNNPGNIEKGTAWNGLADDQPDARFAKFVSPEYGLRAMMKIFLTYSRKYGLNTIREIVARWAPPHENPTEVYAKNVANWSDLPVDEQLDLSDPNVLKALAPAFTRQENGIQPYTKDVFARAAVLALA